jgi:hypothetical protein
MLVVPKYGGSVVPKYGGSITTRHDLSCQFYPRGAPRNIWSANSCGVSLRRSVRPSPPGVGAAKFCNGPFCGHFLLSYARTFPKSESSHYSKGVHIRSPMNVWWLCAHDHHGWNLSSQQYRVPGPTENSLESIELLTEFVRPFDNPSNLHL